MAYQAMTEEEILARAKDLDAIECAKRRLRVRELHNGRDFNTQIARPGPPNQVVANPGNKGTVLIAFPGDVPCDPDAVDESVTCDVDYTVLVPNNADVSTNSIDKLSLQFEWGAAENVLQADLMRGCAGTFIGQRLIVRWQYERDTGTEIAPVTQPPVELRANVALGCPKASPSPSWNLRKTVLVGDIQNATESSQFPIPAWAIEASLESPGAGTAALVLILNQYAAPNGTLLNSSPIGKGTGAGAPIVQGARYFTVDNLGPAVIAGVRVIFTLGQ